MLSRISDEFYSDENQLLPIQMNFSVFFEFVSELIDEAFFFFSHEDEGLRIHVQTFVARLKPKKKSDGEKQPTRRRCTCDVSRSEAI